MRFAFLIPPMMLLAACGSDEKAKDATEVSINAGDEHGGVQITSSKDGGGKVKIGGDGVDIDIEPKPGGILELEFDNGTKMIINRHTAAREIWVAAKSGGFHFRPQDGNWVNTRGGAELWDMLAALASEQAGEAVSLVRPA